MSNLAIVDINNPSKIITINSEKIKNLNTEDEDVIFLLGIDIKNKNIIQMLKKCDFFSYYGKKHSNVFCFTSECYKNWNKNWRKDKIKNKLDWRHAIETLDYKKEICDYISNNCNIFSLWYEDGESGVNAINKNLKKLNL